jgi:hypothetical protein
MTFVQRGVAAIAVVMLAVGAASCGGSSSSGSAGSTGGATTTASTTDTTTSATTTEDTGSGGGSDDGFCGEAKAEAAKLKGQLGGLFAPGESKDHLKNVMTTLSDAYKKLADDAPSDIQPAMQVVAATFDQMNAVFVSVNYNPTKAAVKLQHIVTEKKFRQATQQLAAWGKAHNCKTSS